MGIESGTKLGPHEILAPPGAGGMGEVYRAKDTRLDRTVAIKVSPSHLSDNPDLRQRFEREARAVSSLNHPHICTLHDVGHQDGIDYLVMEFIEGETLTSRFQKGALPVADLLPTSGGANLGGNPSHIYMQTLLPETHSLLQVRKTGIRVKIFVKRIHHKAR